VANTAIVVWRPIGRDGIASRSWRARPLHGFTTGPDR